MQLSISVQFPRKKDCNKLRRHRVFLTPRTVEPGKELDGCSQNILVQLKQLQCSIVFALLSPPLQSVKLLILEVQRSTIFPIHRGQSVKLVDFLYTYFKRDRGSWRFRIYAKIAVKQVHVVGRPRSIPPPHRRRVRHSSGARSPRDPRTSCISNAEGLRE